jgi:hypothetical protein
LDGAGAFMFSPDAEPSIRLQSNSLCVRESVQILAALRRYPFANCKLVQLVSARATIPLLFSGSLKTNT